MTRFLGDNDYMASPAPKSESNVEARTDPVPEPGEYYYDGPYIVFTEAYHLRRGWCCQSGCRHCPYGFEKPAPAEE
jgi:hypothetical protein